MELQKELPPSYISHDPDALRLPSVPQGAIQSQHAPSDIKLPDLRTILSPEFQQPSPTQTAITNGYAVQGSPMSTRSLPRLDAMYLNGNARAIDGTVVSPSETGSVMSVEDRLVRSTSVSMDDPDVRIAAEALSGLGNPDFIRSPPRGSSHMPSHASPLGDARAANMQSEPEPLFELLAQAHPWVHGTINGSMSAYETTKNYSPRFVQYGANLVENHITIPVVSTVSSVGRITGVESGLRRYLGGNNRPSSEFEREEGGRKKRRRGMDGEIDVDSATATDSRTMTPTGYRRDSQDSRIEPLPAYRASKPPSYREESSPPAARDQQLQISHDQRSWPSQVAGQVFVMTSGLGVALSERSRCTLGFCLSLLGQSTQHVTNVMEALKLVLEQYDRSRSSWRRGETDEMKDEERAATPDENEAARALAEIIKRHSEDIWSTLRNVVTSISNSAGGALPDNARQFVRTQLMSLPQRWRIVSDREAGDSETSRGAHRMIEFAKEGLDMMSQITQVMKATLDSAERWLERVGRRRAVQGTPAMSASEKDCEMGDARFEQHHYQQQQHYQQPQYMMFPEKR